MSKRHLPQGWKQVAMGDLFTDEQINFIVQAKKKIPNDNAALQKLLLPYFLEHGAELQAKGLDPVFASYAVPVWLDAASASINN